MAEETSCWEFKLANKESEPDEALVEGIINATESFLRSSEVHRLFIQELVQGTFAEAKDDKLPSKAVRKVIENEIIVMIEGRKEELTNKIAKALEEEANGDFESAKNAAVEGINDVEKLLINHTEAV